MVSDVVDLTQLEQRIDALIGSLRRLHDENRLLQRNQTTLIAERERMAEQYQTAQQEIERLQARLQQLESVRDE